MRINSSRRKPIQVKISVEQPSPPSNESFWRIKFSDVLVIGLAVLTLYFAYETTILGSTEAKQNEEIKKMDTQLLELKAIDTVALRQLTAVDKEVEFISRSYRRSVKDSSEKYISDSLKWASNLNRVWLLFAGMVTRPSQFDNISSDLVKAYHENTIDTLGKIIPLLEIVDYDNSYINSNLYIKKVTLPYLSFLNTIKMYRTPSNTSLTGLHVVIDSTFNVWYKLVSSESANFDLQKKAFIRTLERLRYLTALRQNKYP